MALGKAKNHLANMILNIAYFLFISIAYQMWSLTLGKKAVLGEIFKTFKTKV